MRGTKIFVLQLKDLIRTGIFILVGLLVITLLIWVLLPKKPAASAALYIPGTYSAQIILHNKPVTVEVTVSDSAIIDVALMGMVQTQDVFYPLFRPTMNQLSLEIIEKQSVDITADADAAFTSDILLTAIRTALEQAKN